MVERDVGQWLTGHVGLYGLERGWGHYSEAIATRLHKLRYDLLYPYGGGNIWSAYVGMFLGIATVNIVRAVTIPLAILTVFAFFPKRLMPRSVTEFILWFASDNCRCCSFSLSQQCCSTDIGPSAWLWFWISLSFFWLRK